MNILSVQYFLAVVEEGNISAAARKLFISQQTLSEHVKKLEAELGTPLFKRGRNLALTLAGESFVYNARELIKQYDTLLNDVQSITQERRSRITIAIPTYSTPVALTDIIMNYQAKYPQYEVVCQALEGGKYRPVIAQWPQMYDILGAELDNILNDIKTIDDGLADAQRQLDDLMAG